MAMRGSFWLKMGHGAAIALLGMMLLAGCGVKGPPVPPERIPPPAVKDLRAVVDGNEIRFSWSVPRAAVGGPSGLEGFHLFRWRSSLEAADCPNCPRVFERLADIDVQSGRPEGDERLRFERAEALQAGFRYAFKLVGYAAGGVKSADSNVLNFDY